MDPLRRGPIGYDGWSRGWLVAARPVRRRGRPGDPRLPSPTVGLLTMMRSYLDGVVPGVS